MYKSVAHSPVLLGEMNIHAATRSYEHWMHDCGPVVERHLQYKHAKMKKDPFQFFRGSYYRWAQTWAETVAECADAPIVLAIGDLHVDSYGTWRDAEGRLCWGVDDFDESHPLPYTNDLIRLASSVKIARKLGLMKVKTRAACEVILEGYRRSLKDGGCPMVLAESETDLERLGIEALKAPTDFWEKLNQRPAYSQVVPRDARHCLVSALPHKDLKYRIIQREAGLGSLGQQRFVAIAHCDGGYVAREAKRVVPSANAWLRGRIACRQSYYQQVMNSALRSRDPYQKIWRSWLIRRLSPDSNPIKIEELPVKRDEDTLLRAMGSETANVHLGSHRGRAKMLLKDLDKRRAHWLHSAALQMAKQTIREWKEYRG
jgi:Uncharacterized protein conserved in bacteria (DUF2252)